MFEKFYQLKITLKDSSPSIWRRIIVDAETKLEALSNAIQASMGWDNAYLHLFKKDKIIYKPKEFEQILIEGNGNYENSIISDLLKNETDEILYEYDSICNWEHVVTLEKIMFETDFECLPVCLDGVNACPPEDIGGIQIYHYILEALADHKHPDHKQCKNDFGDSFDPTFFDVEEVNGIL